MNQEEQWRTIRNPTAFSKEKVSFISQPAGKTTHSLQSVNALCPDAAGVCECGSPWSPDNPIESGCIQGNSQIVYEHMIVPVTVYYRTCAATPCLRKKHYDGSDLAVVNMGKYMVSHSILRGYMRQFLTHGYA